MKIRRILATAVAAAVTTPVVFLSAAPAFADTKPSPASTQKPTSDEDDSKYAELVAAVEKAEAKVDELQKQRKALVAELRGMKLDEALRTELTEAEKAVKAAEAAKKAADAQLAAAEEAVKTATPEQLEAAEKAVADAKKAVEEAVAAKTAADARYAKAKVPSDAFDDACVALSRKIHLLDVDLVTARDDLEAAELALEEYETGPECVDDPSLKVTLSGPKKITAGTSAVFSMRVANTGERTLEAVEAYAAALNLTVIEGEIDEDEYMEDFLGLEWSSAAQPGWQKISPEDADEEQGIQLGDLVKGGKADLKLRITVDAKSPAGEGVAVAAGAYENNDGSCGMSEEYANAHFDILAAKTDKPKPKPEPEPTPSETATPTPAPTTGGDGGTTAQGGSSDTPVNGALAATGANDTLPLGLAAAGAVVLGAGALVLTRRRKAAAGA
ncbi:LPXTG cell wall anchor domain-containing protein [Streptomyces sp. NPDC101490]|uniref:LPXTG cell wall anchor domain-containing protein n=1 Tax=Streptomyces sp. NPDC101490 TaxID=3366143 RepID=UPI00382868D8